MGVTGGCTNDTSQPKMIKAEKRVCRNLFGFGDVCNERHLLQRRCDER